MKTLTPEIEKQLEERQNEIITAAMGYQLYNNRIPFIWREMSGGIKYREYLRISDFTSDSAKMELFHWLTKDKREWWVKIKKFSYEKWTIGDFPLPVDAFVYIFDNLPTLFVQWLWVSEEGSWQECEPAGACYEQCPTNQSCRKEDSMVLTPLGEILQEVTCISKMQ